MHMPPAREFGWGLKRNSSAYFDIHKRPNGQFCVVLNHSLLRGVTAEMLYWWFQNFTRIRVRLENVPGYDNTAVPAYWLWHPYDHVSATLSGSLGADGVAQSGAKIRIREAMQYDKYGWRYPVDNTLQVHYCEVDGWAMGKTIPVLGPAMMLRIHFKDVFRRGRRIGAHYHYEIVIGVSGDHRIAKWVNRKITRHFSPEFFEAWQTHNVIEVGTFEHFLPALFVQRDSGLNLKYSPLMSQAQMGSDATGFDAELFKARLASYAASTDPYLVQRFNGSSILNDETDDSTRHTGTK